MTFDCHQEEGKYILWSSSSSPSFDGVKMVFGRDGGREVGESKGMV